MTNKDSEKAIKKKEDLAKKLRENLIRRKTNKTPKGVKKENK